ncbi:MAG: CvpA family protein [Chloroflexota bacterium]
MSLIDVLVAALLVWLAWQGFRRGLAASVVWLACGVLTPYLAGYLAPFLGTWTAEDLPDIPPFLRQPAAFAISFALAALVVGITSAVLFGLVKRVQRRVTVVRAADQVAGALVTMATGVTVLAFVTILATGFLSAPQRDRLSASFWGTAVLPRFSALVPYALALVHGPLGSAPSLFGVIPGLKAPDQTAPESTPHAARLLLTALTVAVLPEGTVPPGTMELLDTLTSGAGSAEALAADPQARLLLESLAGAGGGAAAIPGLPDGTSDAARLILQSMLAPKAAPPNP